MHDIFGHAHVEDHEYSVVDVMREYKRPWRHDVWLLTSNFSNAGNKQSSLLPVYVVLREILKIDIKDLLKYS